MVIKGLNTGKGRKFNGKKYVLGTTFSKDKKRLAVQDAKRIRKRGCSVRIVPLKIGYGVYYKC